MRRTGFKKPTYEQTIKRLKTKPKTKKQVKPRRAIKKRATGQIKRLKTKLWELCKQIIRLKYGNVCYTCGKTGLEGSSWQTGHFVPSSVGGAYLRYDLRNLRPQCYFCNVNAGGNGAIYYKNLVDREGQEYVDKIFKDKQKTIKADEYWYISKIAEYEVYLSEMQKGNTPSL